MRRPPSQRSSVSPSPIAISTWGGRSGIAQFFSQTRLGHEATRPLFLALVDQNPPRQKAERPFGRGHVLVCDEKGDSLRLQDRFDDGDQDEVVGAQDFDQGKTSIGSLAASLGRLYGRAAGSGKGSFAWELSFRSRTSRPIT